MRAARLAVAALLATLAVPASAQERAAEEIVLFERAGCPHCEDALEWLEDFARRRPAVTVVRREVGRDREALAELERLARERSIAPVAVPAILVRGRLFVGFDSAETSGRAIERWLEGDGGAVPEAPVCTPDARDACDEDVVDVPLLGEVSAREVGLPLFTIALGLVDGFNPCAMWVLLFLLSMLVHLQSRARMALIAGTFVVISALVYFAFMAAWLEAYLLIGLSRGIQIVLGFFAIGVAIIHVKDFVALGRGPSLSIPDSAKPGIYARVRAIVRAENLPAAMVMVVTLAVLVNFVELLCTAGIPALYTQVLAAQGLDRATRYAYLALYALAYMADDTVMVTIGVVTLGRTKLQARGARWLKLVSGLVIGALGVVLLVAPEWLLWG